MLENEPSLFIICDPFKVFADQFKVFKIVFYTGWSFFFNSKSLLCQNSGNSKWALWAGQPAPHKRVVSCFSARSPLMTQTPCDENNLRLPINSFIYILKTTWKLTCKQIFYTIWTVYAAFTFKFQREQQTVLTSFSQVPHFYPNTTHHDFKTFFLCIYGAVAVNNNHCVDVESFHTLHLLYLKNIYFKPEKQKAEIQ